MTDKIAIVGLGYVGLPLAVAFARLRPTLGFDLNESKLAHYRQHYDPSGEVSKEALQAAEYLELSSDPSRLQEAAIIIVVVPTPIDDAQRPDLRPLEAACRTVGQHLQAGATVIFESTVYPGCTEEVCVPILERESGLEWTPDSEQGFRVGYSPERINPGDTAHKLETIIKVVSGDSQATLERVAKLYESVVLAGVHRAASIKVAEAAKVIENTQRDLNIALMNELAMIFNRLGIDTLDVLEAAGTKWNFLPFRPGLVGGHCIGVDPYYLTYKAQSVGFHPQVVLGGRQTNDGMGKYIAEQTVKQLVRAGHPVSGARVAVLGLTFKENCPDLRNSRVVDIIRELQDYCCDVRVHDPLASADEARLEYGLELQPLTELVNAQAVVLAVPHKEYLQGGLDAISRLLSERGVVIDVKSVLERRETAPGAMPPWRL
ncbi:nucleotide sugar dehydrogenase [Parahaliea sp. F7430]|uniref:Nucleotide sugar dehydrogenase n=1 Tax=Sediminihaliea albiluteola TaxID=2758564 RepID=A0A7W2TVL7_9GAMM|nr:nucleotide sugar dehydrogenase [Sediminihaliea albiluteola]MBA6412721.1 nucleotide sugar dehydrogenase [Sediminihaliea albiluteola]